MSTILSQSDSIVQAERVIDLTQTERNKIMQTKQDKHTLSMSIMQQERTTAAVGLTSYLNKLCVLASESSNFILSPSLSLSALTDMEFLVALTLLLCIHRLCPGQASTVPPSHLSLLLLHPLLDIDA